MTSEYRWQVAGGRWQVAGGTLASEAQTPSTQSGIVLLYNDDLSLLHLPTFFPRFPSLLFTFFSPLFSFRFTLAQASIPTQGRQLAARRIYQI